MTPAATRPTVTVVHSLPGRLRMRLSDPIAGLRELIDFLREHPGLGPIDYTSRTGSLVVCFDPHAITSEEIAMRTAFRYAMDQGNRPVRLLATPERVVLQNSAVISGIGILMAFGTRQFKSPTGNASRLELVAGIGAAYSVLDHAWKELRSRGYFDPEVLTLVYLAVAFVRGNVLSASVVTWMATFGRHLIEAPSTGVLVEAIALPSENSEEPRHQLVVGPDIDTSERLPRGLVGLFNSALRYAMTGGGAHGPRSFWEELRDVSRVHGEVLEGYGRQPGGIPVRFG